MMFEVAVLGWSGTGIGHLVPLEGGACGLQISLASGAAVTGTLDAAARTFTGTCDVFEDGPTSETAAYNFSTVLCRGDPARPHPDLKAAITAWENSDPRCQAASARYSYQLNRHSSVAS